MVLVKFQQPLPNSEVYTFLSVATCTAADSRAWVRRCLPCKTAPKERIVDTATQQLCRMRRGSDTTFVARVEGAEAHVFHRSRCASELYSTNINDRLMLSDSIA